ncbi:hypothetical protein GC173_16545 [bacterium]|nr:hypothetical protein [bacterium]
MRKSTAEVVATPHSGELTPEMVADKEFARQWGGGYLDANLPEQNVPVGAAELDLALAYLAEVLARIDRDYYPGFEPFCDEDSPAFLHLAGRTPAEHLDLFFEILQQDPDPERHDAGRRLSVLVQNHYFAWLEMVEGWLHGYRGVARPHTLCQSAAQSFCFALRPSVFYRAVPDTRDSAAKYFGRWTASREAALLDLSETCAGGAQPGILRVQTEHAIGPLRNTCFSGTIAPENFRRMLIGATSGSPRDTQLIEDGEWLIDRQTIEWCSVLKFPLQTIESTRDAPENARVDELNDEETELPYFASNEGDFGVEYLNPVLCPRF